MVKPKLVIPFAVLAQGFSKASSKLERSWMLLAILLMVAIFAAACAREEGVPATERRAQRLNKAIMCPVCPGESIDQSQNALAGQMRGIVAEKLAEGWSEGQIKAFFVERYGPSVLMEPPRQGFSLVVWVLPPVSLLAALLAVYVALRVMRRRPVAASPEIDGSPQLTDQELAAYIQRIEAAVDYWADGAPPKRQRGRSGSGTEGGING